jgi:signal transduction histidine kinase
MRYGAFIESEGERLSRMVEKILTFSRSRQQALRKEPADVGALVRATVGELKPALESRGFAADVDCAAGSLVAPVDAAAFREALRNLIENAVSYSGESRRVRITAGADNGDVVVSVTDFGIGISAADQRRIFDRFYRADDPRVTTVRGTGIGLSIVKNIAEGHGGSIAVESRLDVGSTFIIRLPRESEENDAPPADR